MFLAAILIGPPSLRKFAGRCGVFRGARCKLETTFSEAKINGAAGGREFSGVGLSSLCREEQFVDSNCTLSFALISRDLYFTLVAANVQLAGEIQG